jgi:hypothetical protein
VSDCVQYNTARRCAIETSWASGTTSLKSLSNPRIGLTINLKDSAPQGATQIADLSRVSARFVIRNNKFLFNRARGLLLQSSHGLVENNDFTGQTLHGIIVGAGWGEARACKT